MVIRMLQELIGYFNGIKKTQAERRVVLSEIKKNLWEPTVEGRNKRIKSIIWNTGKEKAFNQNQSRVGMRVGGGDGWSGGSGGGKMDTTVLEQQ